MRNKDNYTAVRVVPLPNPSHTTHDKNIQTTATPRRRLTRKTTPTYVPQSQSRLNTGTHRSAPTSEKLTPSSQKARERPFRCPVLRLAAEVLQRRRESRDAKPCSNGQNPKGERAGRGAGHTREVGHKRKNKLTQRTTVRTSTNIHVLKQKRPPTANGMGASFRVNSLK